MAISPASLASVLSNGQVLLDHVRVLLAEAVRHLRLLALQVRQLRLQLLDEGVREDRGKRIERRAVVLQALELVVERFLLEPVRSRLGIGGVQIGQPLHDDVLAVFQGDGIALLAVALERLFAGLQLLALLGQLLAEPGRRVLGRAELVLEVLRDVLPGQRVRQRRGHFRARRDEPDVNEAAVAHRRDGEPAKKRVDDAGLPGRLRRVGPAGRLGWRMRTGLSPSAPRRGRFR